MQLRRQSARFACERYGDRYPISKIKLSIIKYVISFQLLLSHDMLSSDISSFSLLLITGNLRFCGASNVGMQLRWQSSLSMGEVWGLVLASLKDNYQLLNILIIFNLFLFMTICKDSFSFSLLLMTRHLGFCDVRIVGMQLRWQSDHFACGDVAQMVLFLFNLFLF